MSLSTFNLRTSSIFVTLLVLTGVALWSVASFAAGEDNFDENSETPIADNSDTAASDELGPYGGNLWDVAIDPDNSDRVYTVAKDAPNGFYRSSDGGETWSGLEGVDYGGGIAVEVDSTTGDVYATFAAGVYKSTDQGETFTRISQNAGNGLLFANGMLLLGGTETGGVVGVSADNGETITSVSFSDNSDEYIWDIDYSTDGDQFFILTSEQSAGTNRLYRSTDAGATWSAVILPEALNTVTENRFAVSPVSNQVMIATGGNNENLYFSSNGGASWTPGSVASSGVTFDQTGRAWIAEQYSDDGGASWTGYDDDNDASAIGGHNITVDPSNENVIFADGMPGLAKSLDRGLTWTDSNEGILGIIISDISQATNKDIVWAAAYNGIAKTENFTSGNPTWQFPVLEEPGYGIWTDPSNPDVAVAGVSSGTRRTTDGGVTWSEYAGTDLVESYEVFDEIINDINSTSTLYAAVSNNNPDSAKTGAVLQSTDQGITWTDLALPNSGSAQTITQASNGDLYVGLGAESDLAGETGIYKYSNGSWEDVTGAPDQDIVKIIADPDDANTVYAVAGLLYNNGQEDTFGFYKTTDAGATWNQITSGLDELRNFTSLALQDSTDPNTLYLGAINFFGQGELYKSADQGDSWGLLYTGLQDETFYTLIFDGVTAGSSRGLIDVKSKGNLKLKVAKNKISLGNKATLTLTLKDAVTSKKIKRVNVKIFKKKKSQYVLIKKVKTNAKGKIVTKVTLPKAKRYKLKATWTPSERYSEEYSKTISAIKTVRVTK